MVVTCQELRYQGSTLYSLKQGVQLKLHFSAKCLMGSGHTLAVQNKKCLPALR